MTTASPTSAPQRAPADWELTGWHVLMILIAFFGVIFVVNGYFLYSALSTHTGVVANEPYRKGVEYNKRIEADERQSSLGWTDAIESLGGDAPIVFSLRDRYGEPVRGLSIQGFVGRPSTAQFDRKLAFREVSPGRYEAAAGRLDSGAWMLNVEAAEPGAGKDQIVYRARKRLWLKS